VRGGNAKLPPTKKGERMSIRKCECGRVWKLNEIKVGMRDKDSLNCTCGREVISWNGGVVYTMEDISPEQVKTNSNK